MNTLQNVYNKLAKTELAKHEVELSVNDIFNAVKSAKETVNGIGQVMSGASSRVGDAQKLYAVARKDAENYLAAVKSLDPSLLNTDQAKKIEKYLITISNDLGILKEIQSNVSKIGSVASQFKM